MFNFEIYVAHYEFRIKMPNIGIVNAVTLTKRHFYELNTNRELLS